MRGLLALGLLGFASCAQAQDLGAPKLTLSLEAEQVQLIVETLKAISCQTVGQFMFCQQVADLAREIQKQAKAQIK